MAGMAVGIGLIVMPLLIYTAGILTLEQYENGGLGAFLGDFLKGLARFSGAAWIVLLGPYLLLLTVRGIRTLYVRCFSNQLATPPATKEKPLPVAK